MPWDRGWVIGMDLEASSGQVNSGPASEQPPTCRKEPQGFLHTLLPSRGTPEARLSFSEIMSYKSISKVKTTHVINSGFLPVHNVEVISIISLVNHMFPSKNLNKFELVTYIHTYMYINTLSGTMAQQAQVVEWQLKVHHSMAE